MKVKTKNTYLILFVSLFGLISLALFSLFVPISLSIAFFWLGLGLGCTVLFFMVYGKTLEFHENGCTLSWLHIKRFLAWDEIVVKRIEPQHIGGNYQYTKGCMFFSLKATQKSIRTDPALYACFHPLSCFWVYFASDVNGEIGWHLGIYEVDKEKFIALLTKWNVNFEEKRW